jgi:hypothetical protein
MSVRGTPRFEKATNLLTNSCPKVVLAQFVVVVDAKKLHNASVVLWPSRRRKDICRRPEDELGAKVSIAAETEVIKALLELGDFV